LSRNQQPDVLVIGLGRFGSTLALELMRRGHQVHAVDSDPDRVEDYADHLTSTTRGDCTNPDTLAAVGAAGFAHVVVAIGSDIEASILVTAELAEIGVDNIWAKAISDTQARILQRVGAKKVIRPEEDTGIRVAHTLTGNIDTYFELEEDFAVVQTGVPAALAGQSLERRMVRTRYGVTVVAWKPPDGPYRNATPETVLAAGHKLLVAGHPQDIDAFAMLD
jgi:trk system potassium uptake protein TrkA